MKLGTIQIAVILLALATTAFAESGSDSFLRDVLPDGPCEFELMTLQYTHRALELTRKFQAAITTNQDWFLDQVKRARPGEPLDYDPRLGLTKSEYAEYLSEVEKRHLVTTGTNFACVFRRTGDTLAIDTGETSSPLSQIRLNLETSELQASVGRVGTPTWESNDDPSMPIGAYAGYKWYYEKSELGAFSVRIVELEIFRLKPSGKILWRLDDS